MSHWERDINSGAIKNKESHKIIQSGEVTCNIHKPTAIRSCTVESCGYSASVPRPVHGAVDESKNTIAYSERVYYRYCSVCLSTDASLYWLCYDKDGNRCSPCSAIAQKCVTCGYTYPTNSHGYQSGGSGGIPVCSGGCGLSLFTSSLTMTEHKDGSIKTSISVTPKTGVVFNSIALRDRTGGHGVATTNSTTKVGNGYSATGTYTLNQGAHVSVVPEWVGNLTYSGKNYTWYYSIGGKWADVTAPTINSITYSPTGSDWSSQRVFTFKAIDTWSDYVAIGIFKEDGTTVVKDWGSATKSGTTFTLVVKPQIEASATGETFVVKARDKVGNTSQTNFVLKNTDSKPPVLKQINGLEPNIWRRNKLVRVICTDAGIGQVQIAFNDESDFKPATYDTVSGVYYRDFEFTGTVVGVQNRYFYIKDGLGNITAKLFEIGYLDNKAPESPTYKEQLGVGDGKLANTNEIMVEWLIGSDGESGANRVEYSYDCEHWEIGTKQTVRSNQTIFSRTVDNVGNISAVTTVDVLLDIDKPLVGYTDDG